MADVYGSVASDGIPAKFSRFNFAVSHNPLHLGISKAASNLILGDKYKFDKFAIVNLLRSENVECGTGIGSGNVELFVCLHILGDDFVRRSISLCQVSESPGTLTLYATDRFHNHYGIADSEDVFIRLVKVFPLTKVVFGAKSTKCYDWAKNRLFSTELLVSTCQQKVLVRSGDEFLAPIISKFGIDDRNSDCVSNYKDLIALECEPVMQGVISVNTSIVITHIDENEEMNLEPGAKKEDNFSNSVSTKSVDLFPEPLLVSEFTHVLKSSSIKSELCDIIPENCLGYTPNLVCLRPVIVPKLSTHMASTASHLTFAEELCETELRVGVTKATLVQLGGLNGSWVVVSVRHQENLRPANDTETLELFDHKDEKAGDEDGKNAPPVDQPAEENPTTIKELSHLAQVFVINQKRFGVECDTARRCSTDGGVPLKIDQEKEENELFPDDNALYLSPRLWFNLQCHPSRLIQPDTMVLVKLAKTELEYCNGILASSKSVWISHQPPLATELHLGLVKSPDYPMTSKFDKAIKKYFTEIRIVSVGDIVTISTKEFPEYILDVGEGVHTRYPYINFKILKIEPQVEGAASYLVDSLHTTVFQGTPVSSYIPATMDAYLNSDLDPIWCSPSPAGLWKYADQIENLILPFLIPKSHCSRLTPSLLLSGPIGCGKQTVVQSVCRRLNLHCVVANCHDLCADTTASTEAKIKNLIFKGGMCAPCILVMRNIHVLARDRDGTGEDPRVAAVLKEAFQSLSSTCHGYPVVVIATAPTTKSVQTDLHSGFLHNVDIKVPSEVERIEFLHALCETIPTATDVDIAYIAKRTAGLVLGDLCALLAHTVRAATARITSSCSVGSKLSISDEKDICTAGIQVSNVDFESALNRLQAAHADAIGAPKIPSVSWEDVGGLNEVRAQILDTIQLPLQHPELFSSGLRRSGVLLYGPPGTGKTLLAKAVATECSLNFLSVKGPELINMYVGQSEENVREVFVRARSAAPCVIFFDELDSLAPNRGRSGDSGGVMDRVVSQLLAELDGMHKSTDVFVIGATNRPDLLDPALLRPGRFDRLLYLGISRDRASQVKIMKALTRKFTLSPDVMLEFIAESCPMTMTGADFYALCSDAMLNAIKRKISQLESGESAGDDTDVVVENQDFMTALQSLIPSVSEQELQYYQVLQAQISRGF